MTSRSVDGQSGRDATDAARQLRAAPSPLPQPSDATELETLIGQLRFYAHNGIEASPSELIAAVNEFEALQARATAAEGETLISVTPAVIHRLTAERDGAIEDACSSKGALFLVKNDLRAAQQTITQLTRDLETARKVLEQAMDSRAPDLADATFPGWSTRAASFLSSLSHQDEQG